MSKEKIYWNAEEGQIKTKSGRCLYDQNSTRCNNQMVMDGLYERIVVLERNSDTFQRQLQCQAKTGHDMMFDGTKTIAMVVGRAKLFIFKCKHCGLEITKTEKELTVIERNALKKLNII